MVIFDSDVLIWFFRGSQKALASIGEVDEPAVSIVTYMEVMRGARNKAEQSHSRQLLSEQRFTVIPLTEDIGHRASIYIEEYALTSGLEVADALIAATAAERDLELCTANVRHFRAIRDLQLRAFRP